MNGSTQKKQKAEMCQKRMSCLFFFVCGTFTFQPILIGFFFSVFLIKLSLYSMLEFFLLVLLFSRCEGVKMGPTPIIKTFYFYFKSDLYPVVCWWIPMNNSCLVYDNIFVAYLFTVAAILWEDQQFNFYWIKAQNRTIMWNE